MIIVTINIMGVIDSYLSFEIILVIVLFIIITSAMLLYDIKNNYKWDDLMADDNKDIKVDNI